MKADPGEKIDLAGQHPEVVQEMEEVFDRWWQKILPCLENEDALGPKINPFKELYWKQFGGGPDEALLKTMDPAGKRSGKW